MTNRGRYITIGSVTRPGIDLSSEETLSCCNFCCVHAKDISGSESRSFPRHQCHADASCTSLTHAGFQYRKLVRLVGILYLKTRTVMCTTIFGQARSDKIMLGLTQEDLEAFLHVTVVAITLTGILQHFRCQEMTHHTRCRVTCCSTASASSRFENYTWRLQ